MEACRDAAHEKLVQVMALMGSDHDHLPPDHLPPDHLQEVEELQESRRLLQEKVAVVEAARHDLVANKQQLEEDIRVKENSLTIDQVAPSVSTPSPGQGGPSPHQLPFLDPVQRGDGRQGREEEVPSVHPDIAKLTDVCCDVVCVLYCNPPPSPPCVVDGELPIKCSPCIWVRNTHTQAANPPPFTPDLPIFCVSP